MHAGKLVPLGSVVLLSWLILLGGPNLTNAQEITLRGRISDKATNEALQLANVTLQELPDGKGRGTTSDENGLYEFSSLAPGTYLLHVRYVGYKPHRDTLQLSPTQQQVIQHVRLVQADESLNEVTVTGTQERDENPGHTAIQVADIARVPTPAGSGDLAGYLRMQPGVVSTGDRGGQLFIRGGTPSENLVLMDGAQIFQPFHILGFFSAFPQDVISEVDLYAGGFGPRYSGRTSTVMDVRIKNGNLYESNWSASISPFVSEVFFESPLYEGQSSILVSARGSLIESASSLYLEEQQPLRFNSQMVKFTNVGENGPCSGLIMRTYDRGKIDFQSDDFFKWNNIVVGGRCAGVSDRDGVSYTDANVYISHFSNEVGLTDFPSRNSSVNKFHFDINMTSNIKDWTLDYGFFTDVRNVSYRIPDMFQSIRNGSDLFVSSGGYLSVEVPTGEHFSITPGLSYTSYIFRFKPSIEPRLKVSWQPRGKKNEEIHAAIGIYEQPLVGITDFRDAGTAFTAWMPIPDEDRRLQSRHALLGWRQPIGDHLDLSIEGYYKQLFDKPISLWSPIARFTTDLGYADGTTEGIDVRIDFRFPYVFGGIGYGYANTQYETTQAHFERWYGQATQRYHPSHDRRHQFNANLGITWKGFTANISWMYGSGLPYTRPIGFDSGFLFLEQLPDPRGEYGQPRILMDKPFNGRLPEFHRLDVTVEQEFNWSGLQWVLRGGAVNAYDWDNLFYYDVFNQRGVRQLSFMPFVSLKVGSL
jgi:hypothetical protein